MLSVICVLSLSYNLHVLWLWYDLISLFLMLYLFNVKKTLVKPAHKLFVLLVISYFVVFIFSRGHVLMGLLSLWDTFKHIPYILFLYNLSNNGSFLLQHKVFKKIYKLILTIFFIQASVIAFQYSIGVFFDDIAGTFGDGGSHAIGYISLLAIIATIIYSKSQWLVTLVIVSSFLMNIASENAGFYVLLIFLILGIVLTKKWNLKFIIRIIVASVFLYFLLDMQVYSERTFIDVISSRLISMFEPQTIFDPLEVHGRSSFLFLASLLGGWFGYGQGAFSNIYMMEGYATSILIDPQINITEASHLIAESGFVGFLLILLTYISFLQKFFLEVKYKLFISLFFTVCIFYSAILMNESHMLLFLLVTAFLVFLKNMNANKGYIYR